MLNSTSIVLVLVFGLSANPPTGLSGHAGIVKWAATEARVGERAPDRVWVLPVYRHAFVDKQDMPSFSHRFEMAKLAFEHLPGVPAGRVVVKDTEKSVHAEAPDQMVGTMDV